MSRGPSKKPRQLTREDVAKKIEDGVRAGAEDMKIDGVLVNGLEVNQDEEYVADEWVFDELSAPRPGTRRSATWTKNWTCSSPPLGKSAVAETGRPPISTTWVDVNKGVVQNPINRCRLAVRDFRFKGESRQVRSLCGDAAFGGQVHVVSHGRSALSGEAVFKEQDHVD